MSWASDAEVASWRAAVAEAQRRQDSELLGPPVARPEFRKFNPLEPRDPHGRWSVLGAVKKIMGVPGREDEPPGEWKAGNWEHISSDDLRQAAREFELHSILNRPADRDPWGLPADHPMTQRLVNSLVDGYVPEGTTVSRNGPYEITNRGGAWRPDEVKTATLTLDALAESNPLPEGVEVSKTSDQRVAADGALVFAGTSQITHRHILVYRELRSGPPGSGASPGHFMPAADETDPLRYLLTHEYGHALMLQSGAPMDRVQALFEFYGPAPPANHSYFGRYGSGDAQEAFAEAFAEFFLSAGMTENPAAQAYAKEFGWHPPVLD